MWSKAPPIIGSRVGGLSELHALVRSARTCVAGHIDKTYGLVGRLIAGGGEHDVAQQVAQVLLVFKGQRVEVERQGELPRRVVADHAYGHCLGYFVKDRRIGVLGQRVSAEVVLVVHQLHGHGVRNAVVEEGETGAAVVSEQGAYEERASFAGCEQTVEAHDLPFAHF